MAESLTNNTPQNSFLQGINEIAGTIGALGTQAAQVYSTFIGAKTTADLQKAQASNFQNQPTQSQLSIIGAAGSKNWLIYAGIGAAVLGTAMLVYKSVK